MDDKDYMRRAIDLARKNPGSPIGCVIVLGGIIVGEGHNEVDGSHDPTAHAEIVAIRRACERLKTQDLHGAVLYSTLQPCGMCSMASIWSGVGRILFGAGREDVHQMYFEDRHLGAMDFIADAYRDDLSIKGGILKDECASLYYRPDDDPPIEEQANC
jgi:tRNA(adenine34) deaminase